MGTGCPRRSQEDLIVLCAKGRKIVTEQDALMYLRSSRSKRLLLLRGISPRKVPPEIILFVKQRSQDAQI